MVSIRSLALAVISAGLVAAERESVYKHVAVFSIDGFHASDVAKYIALRPKSTIATLLETGYEYTEAFTSAPSDSFPGTQAQFTGASPRTTGVWYDDTYDRKYFAPGSNCTEKPGAEGMISLVRDTQTFVDHDWCSGLR
jgi:predicted AlkP superfamily pyrophosphatase or phosphodiesterase